MMKYLAALLSFACSTVMAHPGFDEKVEVAGKIFKADMLVTHGCGDSPTIKLVIDIPEDVLAVTPRIKSGWNIETVESELKEHRMVFAVETTKYTSQIIWSGGSLPSDYFDEFSFNVLPPNEETTLYFPTTLYCDEGVDAYTDIPDPAAKDAHDRHLAPSVKLVKDTVDGGR